MGKLGNEELTGWSIFPKSGIPGRCRCGELELCERDDREPPGFGREEDLLLLLLLFLLLPDWLLLGLLLDDDELLLLLLLFLLEEEDLLWCFGSVTSFIIPILSWAYVLFSWDFSILGGAGEDVEDIDKGPLGWKL